MLPARRACFCHAFMQMGHTLGLRYKFRLKWWVRCFIFGLDDAAKCPFVMGLEEVDDANKIHGGKFLASALMAADYNKDQDMQPIVITHQADPPQEAMECSGRGGGYIRGQY